MGLSIQLEIADELIPPDTLGKPVLARALTLAASAMAQGRTALTVLGATELRPQQLLDAVFQVAQRYPSPDRFEAHLVTRGPQSLLQGAVAEEMISIAQEAVSNAMQHTGGAVAVHIEETGKALEVSVQDWGNGIPRPFLASGRPGHFGLAGMRERAVRIGARLQFDSAEKGTLVRMRVPARLAYVDRATFGRRLRQRVAGLFATRNTHD